MKHYSLYFFLFCIILLLPSFIQKEQFQSSDKPAYKIFTKEGKEVSFAKMANNLMKSEVVLFGEFHNNPIVHWLELSLLKSFDKSKVIAGAEMFVSSEQEFINDYLNGKIGEDEFKKQVQLWNNYPTDYKPLVDYSAKNQIPFLATNCDRKFARLVARNGVQSLDTISENDKKYIVPLPFKIDLNLPGYKQFMEGNFHGHGGNGRFMAEAQALKDATMAHFIYSNRKPGKTFIHFNGSYHNENYEGIYWYLKGADSALNIKTICTVEQSQLNNLNKENKAKADYIIVVPDDMTKTY